MRNVEDVDKEKVVDNIRLQAKTRKGNLILKKREGEYVETSKRSLFITGNKSSEQLKNFMLHIHLLQKPHSVYKPKKHPHLANILEKLDIVVNTCIVNSCAFFFSVIPNKKYPSRFLLGRIFNKKLLDYYVFSLISFIPQSSFPLSREVAYDTKPIVLCQGSYFYKDETTKYVKNILLDFFKHKNVSTFSKNSLQRLIVLTAYETQEGKDVISFRQYLIKSEYFDTPELTDLQEVGPRFEFHVLDCKTPEYETMQEALKTVSHVEAKKNKNKIKDAFGNVKRKMYVQKPDFKNLHTKHNKFHRQMKRDLFNKHDNSTDNNNNNNNLSNMSNNSEIKDDKQTGVTNV